MSDKHTLSADYQIKQARKVKRLEAENAKLRALLCLVRGSCKTAHHCPADRHDLFTPCPIEARIEEALARKPTTATQHGQGGA